MLSQFAYAKLQSIHGEQHFIHNLPALITSKRCKQWSQICGSTPIMDPRGSEKFNRNKSHATKSKTQMPQCLAITNIFSTFPMHAIIFYSEKNTCYEILPLTALKVNDKRIDDNDEIIQQISQCDFNIFDLIQKYQKSAVALSSISKIMIFSQEPRETEVYYFCLPSSTPQRVNPNSKQGASNQTTNNNILNPSQMAISMMAPIQNPPITNGSKWSNDDHEQLKKLLLQYGYGRWKSIQRASASLGGKLDGKNLDQVKAYANSFLRALGLSLPQDQNNLKIFLQKLIEEHNQQFQEYQPSIKEWDQQIQLPQRSTQYTKRLQLLSRVKNLIRKYRQEELKKMTVRDKRKVNWDGLLNFIPITLLFGQRPAVWWTKKHDVDLLLGVYKYGYANYISIRAAKQYCFLQLEKSQMYQDFPVADNLTRRLKKLINTIVKIQHNQGQIAFDDQAQSQEDQKCWSDYEKRTLFNILVQFGIPLTSDNRNNWPELKDKIKNHIKDFSKSPAQVQKMVSRIRWNCQQIISDQKMREELMQPTTGMLPTAPFKIYYEMAQKFCRIINILQFVRKIIFVFEADNFKTFIKECEQKSQTLGKQHPAHIQHVHNKKSHKAQLQPAVQCKDGMQAQNFDQQLLNHINKSGITPVTILGIKLNDTKIVARLQWQIEVYRFVKEKVNEKKKKFKTFDDSTKKRSKFQIVRDKQGNIMFPININPSLTLVATGRICSQPNYHSEHNLFPIGYVSIRTHMSMFNKGMRVKYTCQILQGEGRPIYRVTSEEDPVNPIVRDSSTGCWVYICQKVNNLQENRKDKVTISGTQRFGLLENNVIRLLEDLPEAEKCVKYKFKKHLLDAGSNRQ